MDRTLAVAHSGRLTLREAGSLAKEPRLTRPVGLVGKLENALSILQTYPL